MSIFGFAIVAFMLAAYVLLDGYDLGVATISPIVARTDAERAATMRSIGPFWNGNEVWLIAAGGVLFALFPRAYASSFSGFYLPLIVVLWLLMFRGIALELRRHFPSLIWHQFWDFCFSSSSVLLILILGVASGNLLRGVPLDANGYFQGTFAFLLNPYALLVGALAIVALAQHGTAFLWMRVDGPPAQRASRLMTPLWVASIVFYLLVTGATFRMRGMGLGIGVVVVVAISLAGLIALRMQTSRQSATGAFYASCVFVASILVAAAGTLFPYLLPAFPAGHGGISVYDSPPSPGAFLTQVIVTVAGLILVIVYGTFALRRMAAKVRVGE
jgi:cytochrome bd ubiquinol oxidase subunit II